MMILTGRLNVVSVLVLVKGIVHVPVTTSRVVSEPAGAVTTVGVFEKSKSVLPPFSTKPLSTVITVPTRSGLKGLVPLVVVVAGSAS